MKIGVVGGSDYSKIAEQLGEGDDGEQATSVLKTVDSLNTVYHSTSCITLHDLILFTVTSA